MGAEVDAFSFALVTIASRLPQYRFEDLLDKTPAWIDWALTQVTRLSPESMTAFSRFTVTKPKQKDVRTEENDTLRKMGIKIWRI